MATSHRLNLAFRGLRVGAIALAIGVLIYFAARSPNGGLAGILLSALFAGIAFVTAFALVRGVWRVSQRIEARHAILGGCLTVIAVCGIGGFLLLFGSQLLIGVIVGGLAAIVNDRARWVTWQQLFGIDPSTPGPPVDPPATGAPFSLMWSGPLPVAAATLVALVCVAAGIFFAGLGTIRVLEGASNLVDFECSPPCALVNGLWVHVIPDSQGHVIATPDATTIEIRVSFSDDLPGERVTGAAAFTLSSPGSTYPQLLSRPECDLWVVHLHIDDKTGVHALCFSSPSGVIVNPDQLILTWQPYGGPALIPLCTSMATCAALRLAR